MKPVRQTIFAANDPRGRGNCMSACLASLLEIPLAKTIDTTSNAVWLSWTGSIRRWLTGRGFKLLWLEVDDPRLDGAYSIGFGDSLRGPHLHTVVCKSGRMVFDPHPSDDGVEEILRHQLLAPLTEAEQREHDLTMIALRSAA